MTQAATTQPLPRMSLAEFLEWDGGTDTRYELIDGRPRAMAPTRLGHGAVAQRLGSALEARLRMPCRVVQQPGVRRLDKDDRFFIPDLAVTCRPIRGGTTAMEEPRLIVEVVSSSTYDHDRGVKLDEYMHIESVEEVWLVWADRRRLQRCWRDGERWILQDYFGDAAVPLPLIGGEVALDFVYEGLEFEDDPAAAATRET